MTVMQLFGLALACLASAAVVGWHGYRQQQQWQAQSHRYGPVRQRRDAARDWLAWCGRGYPVGPREQARLQQLLAQAGVFLLYTSPSAPDNAAFPLSSSSLNKKKSALSA
ncbi:hypothetical protein ACLHZ7_21065, partial [Aeromonas salmonicida]